jgi:hypothetical protein
MLLVVLAVCAPLILTEIHVFALRPSFRALSYHCTTAFCYTQRPKTEQEEIETAVKYSHMHMYMYINALFLRSLVPNTVLLCPSLIIVTLLSFSCVHTASNQHEKQLKLCPPLSPSSFTEEVPLPLW